MHALARNPDYRPESAAALAEELAIASPEPPTRQLPSATATPSTEVLPSQAPTQVQRAPRTHAPRRALSRDPRLWLALAGIAVAVAIVIGLALGTNGGSGGKQQPASNTPAVQPVPPASDAAGTARNFADWLRENSR
jgi:uncharacterized protein HemX